MKSVTLLGASAALPFKAQGDSVVIDLPAMPAELMSQPGWVLKLSQ